MASSFRILNVLFAIGFLFILAACGGGGGSAVITEPPTPPDGDISPPDGDISPPDTSPTRGSTTVTGINSIPLSQIQATNSQMKDMFAIAQSSTIGHAKAVRAVACSSYVTGCEDPESYSGKFVDSDEALTIHTGSAPYTSLTHLGTSTSRARWLAGQLDAMSGLKIAVETIGIITGRIIVGKTLPSYLIVKSAGNNGGITYPDNEIPQVVVSAINADKLLLIAGWDKQSNGNYVRHTSSSNCLGTGLGAGCLWAQYEFPGVGRGTSLSAPHVASALASVLAVFPDTTHQNLAKFAKACARKSGNGIETLLSTSGGVGVADFECMGGVTNALTNLPTGGRTDVTVNGKTVSVGGRDVTVSFASSSYFAPPLEEGEEDLLSLSLPFGIAAQRDQDDAPEFSVRVIPVGNNHMMLVGTQTLGDFFVSGAFGTRDDFFGFAEGHEDVHEIRMTAGHRNFFGHLSHMRSGGGGFIDSAVGQSIGLTVRDEFNLTENTSLSVTAQTERFLGGDANLRSGGVSFGKVDLNEGEWNHSLDLGSAIKIGPDQTMEISSGVNTPGNGDVHISANLRYKLVL